MSTSYYMLVFVENEVTLSMREKKVNYRQKLIALYVTEDVC